MQLLQSRIGKQKKLKWRRALWVLLPLLVAGAWFFRDPLMQRYRFWKQERALGQAREFIQKRDASSAQLALDVALKAVPGNAETIRVAADMLEQVGAPQAMRLRRAVVAVAPDSAEDAAKLVLSCLRFRDFNAAKDALANTSPALSVQLPMLRAALAYALTTSDAPVADVLFQELKKRFPDDTEVQFSHALLHLHHPDAARRTEARRQLEEIAKKHPERALQINREFAGQALQQRDYAEAKTRLAIILTNPGVTLNDRLQKANLDLLIDRVSFETVFAALAPLAGKTEGDAIQFAQWLLVQNRPAEADRWLGGLSEAVKNSPAVRSVQAEIVGQLKDWDRLARLLEAGDWGPIPAESVRLAMSARLVSGQGNTALRLEIWNAAVQAAGSRLPALGVLQRLASLWGWEKETESTLWTLARTFPDQTWAHQALFNNYRAQKDTAGMREVLTALRQTNAVVPRYQHDWALLSLLTDPRLTWNPPKETMKSLYEQDRKNATYGTGYALALAQAGKGAEALAVIEAMSVSEREYPPRLPYMGYVYGVARKKEELARMQTLAEGLEYLPEERQLLVRGQEALERKPDRPLPKRTDKAVSTVGGAIEP